MPKATRFQTKEHNTRLVYKTIYADTGISRAEISRKTKLTKTTVSNIVAELVNEGLVEEIGMGISDAGKPPILLSAVDDARYFMGIDLANSVFRGAIVNLRGEIKYHFSQPIYNSTGDSALKIVFQLVDDLLNASENPVRGIGIGTPGLVDPQNGVIRTSVNLDWQDLPLRDLIQKRYELSCFLANDCQAAALGEYTFARNSSTSNLVVVKVGRGIGSGIVLNGKLHYGDGYGAGEIGHVVVVDNGERCACGNYGCLETVASTSAIIRLAKKLAENDQKSLLYQFVSSPDEITTECVLQASNAGDLGVQTIISNAGYYLGTTAAYLIGILNVQHIVFAGSVIRFGNVFMEPLKRAMQDCSMSNLSEGTKIDVSSLGQDIVIMGAASLLLANEFHLT